MMIDLSDCVIYNDVDTNPDSAVIVDQVDNYPHLTPDKWVVVLPCKGSAIDHDTISKTHFVSIMSIILEGSLMLERIRKSILRKR